MEEVEEIKLARKVLEEISQDEHERYLADLREKYVLDMNSIKSEALRNGIEQGLKEGKEQEKTELAKKMKEKGIDIDTIIEITKLTKKQIENM